MTEQWMEAVTSWVSTFDEFAPGVVEGLYIVGSIALDDWQPGSSDIDIVAVTAEPADEEMSGALRAAHAAFTEAHANANADVDVDGPFLAWGDLTIAPQGVSRPWTLDGVFHHDAECFELNPITWYTLAAYGVRVRGAHPSELPIPLDRDERVRFVVDNARNYWTRVLDDLQGALREMPPDGMLPSSVPVWCLLGVCRMLYTATTGDVTSKSGAGRWAADALGDQHRQVCGDVVELRHQPEQPVTKTLLQASADAMEAALQRIGRAASA